MNRSENVAPSQAQTERLTTADLARRANGTTEQIARVQPDSPSQPADAAAPLFPPDVSDGLLERWTEIQTGFVDKPRDAVERADELVADAIQRLAGSFADERSRLEAQWTRDGDVSTEDLRVALQRYRAFFHRLLHL